MKRQATEQGDYLSVDSQWTNVQNVLTFPVNQEKSRVPTAEQTKVLTRHFAKYTQWLITNERIVTHE